MSSQLNDTHIWDALRNKVVSKKGGWRIGEAVYNHGYDMMNELVGHRSYFQVLVLNVTGKLPSESVAKWLEAGFICLSWPDPRIWCNQIGALAGTIKASCPSAVAGGILAADSRMYGSGTMKACIDFIKKARVQQLEGMSIDAIVECELAARSKLLKSKPVIVGYSRPIASGDERVSAMQRVGQQLGFVPGSHEQIAIDIHNYLNTHHNEGFNVAGYMAAVLSDLGYDGKNVERLFSSWVQSGVHACYAEAADNTELSFLPLRCSDIKYTGPAKRKITQ
ncbi:MAG: hypothetical protein ACFHVJ_12355 [Aestuariibacter sp.]